MKYSAEIKFCEFLGKYNNVKEGKINAEELNLIELKKHINSACAGYHQHLS